MWPSEDTAVRLYNWANVGLIFSLVFGVVSTGLVVWMGHVKETYTQEELAGTKRLAAETDLKRIALVNRILDIFGPRQLSPEQSVGIVKNLAGLKGTTIDVYIMDIGDSPDSPEFKDSVKTGLAILHLLRAAQMEAEGWVLSSCQGAMAKQVNISVAWNGSDNDRKIAGEVLAAFPRDLGIFSEVENGSEIAYCKKFSGLDRDRPNKRRPGAAISIVIGRKINPLLTREMLELDDDSNISHR